MLKDKIIFSN